MKDCETCNEKEALVRFAVEKANECAKLKAELAKAKDAICEAVYRSGNNSHTLTPAGRQAEFYRMRAEQLAEQLREKDMELAQKDAIIRELRGKLDYLLGNGRNGSEQKEEQADDLYTASRRFFEALFSSLDGKEEDADA